MLKQRWIGLLFELIVRTIDAIRVARASSTFVALALAAVALACLHPDSESVQGRGGAYADAADESSQGALVGSIAIAPSEAEVTRISPPRVQSSVLRGEDGSVQLRTAPALNREQVNIARFIAKRYQVAIDEVQHFVDFAYKAAGEFKLDPMLILAVISVESSFDPSAQSNQGAQGLMQVLTRVHAEKFAPFGGVAAAFDPLANIRVGARILRDYVTRLGSVEAALKSYVGAAIMPDDQGYGNRVLEEREKLAAAAAGKPIPVFARPAQPVGGDAQVSVGESGAPVRTVAEAIDVSSSAPAAGGAQRAAEATHAVEHPSAPAHASPDL